MTTTMITRRIRSKLVRGGRKYSSMKLAENSTEISGTPRMNSMNPTDSVLTSGMFDCRPSAIRMPMGSEAVIAAMPMTKDSRNPPKSSDRT